MIIDFHTHIFPEKMASATISQLEGVSGTKAATNGCLDGLLISMEEAGVDCSVIMPVVTKPKQFLGINRFAHEINECYGAFETAEKDFAQALHEVKSIPKVISFGGIHPDSEDYKSQLRELKSMGFKGIKLHPDYQGVMFNDTRYKRIVSYASELDMIILVHAGIDIGLPEPVHCTPAMALEMLRETEASKLVLAHLGGWKLWDSVEELLVGQKVYLDIAFTQAYIGEEQFYRIINKHGSDKILFATDSPWAGQKQSVEWLQNSALTAEAKEQIFWKNAFDLLKLT